MQFWTLLFTRTNWAQSFGTGFLFLYYPFFMANGDLPYGVYIPGVDLTTSPSYEFAYAFQFVLTFLAQINYIPFVNMFIGFNFFGITLMRILTHELRTIADDEEGEHVDESPPNNKLIAKRLLLYIEYYKRIIRYVDELNGVVSTIMLVEIILFGTILFVLLFTAIVTTQKSVMVWAIIYIVSILFQLLPMYYLSNQLIVESSQLGYALYDAPWYTFNTSNQKTILLFILRSQRPLEIMIGNVAPVTLQTFQSILNMSYSYCNILRGEMIQD